MPQRFLTRGEKWLSRHVFGHTIAVDNVQVISRPGISGGFTPYGRINLDPSFYADDFIGHKPPNNLFNPAEPLHRVHHFLHEMAHSWQHFVGMLIVDSYRKTGKAAREVLHAHGFYRKDFAMKAWGELMFRARYSYDITAGADLMDFTMEQQCEIIADYYAMTLWSWINLGSKHFGHLYPTRLQLEAVLAQFRADPAYPRSASRMRELRARYRAVPR